MLFFLLQSLFIIFSGVPMIFGFAVVAQMLLEDEVCIRL